MTMTLIGIAAAALWIALALRSALSRARFPKKGLRASEKQLLIASAVMAVAWLAQLELAAQKNVAQASALATSAPSKGSCATLDSGMTTAEVKRRMGEPDEVRSDEETRGPGTSVFVYRGSRCAVHLLDERVEFVD